MAFNDEITIAVALLAAGIAGLIGHTPIGDDVCAAATITLVLLSTYQLATALN